MINGQTFKTLRIRARYTQQELAQRIGISRETIVAIENNYESTIKHLSFYVAAKWLASCKFALPESTVLGFKAELLSLFDI